MLLALAEKADENGICWPWFDTSYETLADMTGVQRRSAIRLVDSLCETGYLIKIEVVGRGKSNYFLVAIGLDQDQIATFVDRIRSKKTRSESDDYTQKGDSGVTNSYTNSDSTVTNLDSKKVTPESLISKKGDSGVTKKGEKGDSGVTPPYLKTPSKKNPSKESLSKDKEPVQNSSRQMFSTLAQICDIDLTKLSSKRRGELNQTEKKLRDSGIDPAELPPFRDWWNANDWRGKRGQPPEPAYVFDEWGRYKKWCDNRAMDWAQPADREDSIHAPDYRALLRPYCGQISHLLDQAEISRINGHWELRAPPGTAAQFNKPNVLKILRSGLTAITGEDIPIEVSKL